MSSAPSPIEPESTRATDSLPPWVVCSVFITWTIASLPAGTLRRCAGVGDARRLMPDRLEETADAVAVLGRADQHRTDQAGAHLDDEIGKDLLAFRLDILEELLHEAVVVVGELLEHGEAGFRLPRPGLVGHVDHFARRVLAVDEGALEREIDVAGDGSILIDRDVAEDEGSATRLLQRRQRIANAALGLVDLVEEQDARDVLVLERLQDDLQGGDLLLVGLGDDHGKIDRGQHALRLVGEFDRTGTVDEGDAVAHEVRLGDIHLDAHLMRTGFRRCIADGVPLGDGALAGDRSGACQDCLEQGCLPAGERTDQCDAPGPGDSAVCHWLSLPSWLIVVALSSPLAGG